MQLSTTVYLPGHCDEAIAFYQAALGSEVMFIRRVRDDVAAERITHGTENKVLRAALRIGQSVLYLSDGHAAGQPAFQGFSLSLKVPTRQQAERIVDAVSDGGRVLMALRHTAWASTLAFVLDRFGVHWTVEVDAADTSA